VALIFGQDNPPPRPDLANTSPLDIDAEAGRSERPTAVLSNTSNTNTVDLRVEKTPKNKEESSDK
jgi:hypothetical protein